MEDSYNFSEFTLSAVEDKYSSSNDNFWGIEGLNEVKKVQFSGTEDQFGGIESICSSFGFFQNDLSEEYLLSTNQQKHHKHYEPLDNLHLDMVFPQLQFHEQNPTNDQLFDPTKTKQNHSTTPLASLEILKNYGKGFKRLLGDEAKSNAPQMFDDLPVLTKKVARKLSTEDVMRIAGTRFLQSSSDSSGLNFLENHPFGFSFSGLSDEEKEDVALAESLLASVEKVDYKQFERASKLLTHCESLSSKTGSPVKRVVHYFSEALRRRIDKETGRVSVYLSKESFDPEEASKELNPAVFAFYEELPYCQVTVFTAVQAIIETVAGANKIHIIDLEIRKGVQWTVLIQALESRQCPIELLKITAIGSGTTSKHTIEDTGKRLKGFAESFKIPFKFNMVMVSDMLQLREDLFEIDSEETIAVYSQYALSSKIRQSDQLETIMRVIRTISPVLMVVAELEANHNSTSFVNRFIEALFYFSAFFDSVDSCMKHDDPNRKVMESMFFGHGIRNIVAEEGAERKSRTVKIDVWRAFFTRFGMVETELSMVSLYQAGLVAKRFPCGSYCTFDMNGHCLLIGWKGTPISSVSVWKFL